MKVLMFALGLAAVTVTGVALVACGPQQPYCKDDSTGGCRPDSGVVPEPDLGQDVGMGESTILGGDDAN